MTKLEKILVEKGLKQSWLAKKINKSPAELNRWVKGKVIPVYANMNKISKALNIPIEEIFYKEGIEVSAISNITSHDGGMGDEKQPGNIDKVIDL